MFGDKFYKRLDDLEPWQQTVFALALAGVLLGISIADTLDLIIGSAVPYSISVQRMAVFGTLLLVMAVGGTLLSLLRIARVDPLAAINNAG